MKPLALVVDNDSGTRKLLDVLLMRMGIECDLASTGADGIALLEHVPYDVTFCDLLMPGTPGEGVLEWIARERPDALRRTIVLTSAHESHMARIRERWPQVRVIRKPFEVEEVMEAAQHVVTDPLPRHTTPAAEFCRRSIRAGAKSGVAVRSTGEHLELVLSYGYAPGYIQTFFPMRLDAPYPLCASVRDRRPLWITSIKIADPDYPLLSPVWKQNESYAVATVPFLQSERAIGAAGWTFREPRAFRESEQRAFLEIAELAAAALETTPEESVRHARS